MEIFEYVLLGVLGLIGLYIISRLISIAVFKSWIDAKLQTKERREDDGDNESN